MNIPLSLTVAFLGYSVKAVSQAGQRAGLKIFENQKIRGAIVWSAATIGTTSSVLILFAAVTIGKASLVGAMAGSGLITVAFFSRFILKEEIHRHDIIGIAGIVFAILLLGLFDRQHEESLPIMQIPLVALGAVTIAYATAFAYFSLRGKQRIASVLAGGLAGALGGFMTQFQRFSSIDEYRTLSIIVWLSLSVLSLLVMQVSLRKCETILAVPMFTCNYVLVPVVGGAAYFDDVLAPAQWIGVALMIGAVLLMTVKRGAEQSNTAFRSPPRSAQAR